mmetsp:Transcript_97030/g.212027  ORF Transcript_97030/g.212027 Transcript_97030/m.212027 type:complete len:243 (-) Transcript_97030:151-879(-)
MILPSLGPENEEDAPLVVKDFWSKLWWALWAGLLAGAVLNVMAGDVFGTVFMLAVALVVHYMVSDNCKHMSQYCLVLFGVMVFIQALFDSVTLLTMVDGRTTQHRTVTTSLSPDGRSTTQTIKVEVESHSFFDSAQDLRYNMQSAVRIASPVLMIFAAMLSYWTYNEFPSTPGSDDGPRRSLFGSTGGGPTSYGGMGNRLGGPAEPSAGNGALRNGGQAVGPSTHHQNAGLWQGTGQRLGSG